VIAKLKDKFEIAQRKLPISNLWWLFVTIYRVIVSREGFCPDFFHVFLLRLIIKRDCATTQSKAV